MLTWRLGARRVALPVLAVMLVAMVLQLQYRPFLLPLLNRLESLCILTIILTQALTLAHHYSQASGAAADTVVPALTPVAPRCTPSLMGLDALMVVTLSLVSLAHHQRGRQLEIRIGQL